VRPGAGRVLNGSDKPCLQDKLAEVDKSANKKDVPLGMLKADGSSKRSRSLSAPVASRRVARRNATTGARVGHRAARMRARARQPPQLDALVLVRPAHARSSTFWRRPARLPARSLGLWTPGQIL